VADAGVVFDLVTFYVCTFVRFFVTVTRARPTLRSASHPCRGTISICSAWILVLDR